MTFALFFKVNFKVSLTTLIVKSERMLLMPFGIQSAAKKSGYPNNQVTQPIPLPNGMNSYQSVATIYLIKGIHRAPKALNAYACHKLPNNFKEVCWINWIAFSQKYSWTNSCSLRSDKQSIETAWSPEDRAIRVVREERFLNKMMFRFSTTVSAAFLHFLMNQRGWKGVTMGTGRNRLCIAITPRISPASLLCAER